MSNFLCFSGSNFLIACSTSNNEKVCNAIFLTSLKSLIKIISFVKSCSRKMKMWSNQGMIVNLL